jgi:hypothetical protein
MFGAQQGFYTHLRRYSASVIFSVLFGKRAPRIETKGVPEAFEITHLWAELLAPGISHLSEIFPNIGLFHSPYL